ncbi:glucosyl hydrolase [Corallococcus coralloides]|uniref:chitinase n=2 Tax=Corallococcus coralloides TaxID=184914 RepID=A0A410RSZ9_CORCK|nr:glucosyl hydrolase [Corallococcus coralloides]
MNSHLSKRLQRCVVLALVGMFGGCDFGMGPDKEDAPPVAPEAPQQVVAQPADASALVTWTVPPKDGGSPILYYVVRCTPDCGGALVNAPDTQATIRGLNNAFPYAFKVAAVNAMGEGPGSMNSEIVTPQAGMAIATPTVPGQPRAVNPTAGNGQAYVSWLAPASFGGRPLSYYKIMAEPGGLTQRVNAPSSGMLFEGLANGTAYTFSICAANEMGEGPCARASAPVSPRSGGAPVSWVMGYWVGYQKDLYPAETVDMSLLTHVAMGRIRPKEDGTVTKVFDISEHEGPIHARKIAEQAHAAGKKALLMLGGMDEHVGFKGATETVEKRRNFARNIVATVHEFGYDGVDVDWEPIELPGDGPPLLALLDDLRALDDTLIITVPVGWVNSNFGLSQEEKEFYPQLVARVDQLNIMSYKMSGDWADWGVWHSSALFGDTLAHPTSVSSSVKAYLAAGIPAQRLGVGTGFFGTCWKNATEPGQPVDGPNNPYEEQSDNRMSYANIQKEYLPKMKYIWDATARVPYLSDADAKGPQSCNFVSYEDIPSVTEKGRWTREQGLGGAIIWTINQGHIKEAPAGERDPLLKAVHAAFLKP